MEFRTNSQFANNGINMSSPIVGGVGYNPTPSNFCYNGDGVGKYTSNLDPCQPPVGFMNPPGGYVTSYNPYAMNYGYCQQQVGPIFDSNLPITNQFYYQMGFSPVTDRNGNPVNQYNTNNYYASAWQMYNQRKEEEQNYQKHYQEQQDIWKQLTILNRRNLGYDDGEKVFQDNEDYKQEFYAKQYETYNLDREYASIYYISQFPTSDMPGYVNPYRQEYIESWNKTFDQRSSMVPEGITMYDFFNGGYANELWIDALKQDALERAKDMSSLYNKDYFRSELNKSNPLYDPLTGTAGGKLTLNNMSGSRGLNIDDMEITLPPHIANDEYAKKREKFMNTILSNTRSNISDLSTMNFAREGMPIPGNV